MAGLIPLELTMPKIEIDRPRNQYTPLYNTRKELDVSQIKKGTYRGSYTDQLALNQVVKKDEIEQKIKNINLKKDPIKKLRFTLGVVPKEYKNVHPRDIHAYARDIINDKIWKIAYTVRENTPTDMVLGRWSFAIHYDKIKYFVYATDGELHAGEMAFKRPKPVETRVEVVEIYHPLDNRSRGGLQIDGDKSRTGLVISPPVEGRLPLETRSTGKDRKDDGNKEPNCREDSPSLRCSQSTRL